MASKCTHCDNHAIPAWNEEKAIFDTNIRVCASCFSKETHWQHPFVYEQVFMRNNLKHVSLHPEYPLAFHKTDINYNEMIAKANAWIKPDGKCGLILHGETGTGKSRAAWLVYNRLWLEEYPKRSMFLQMRKFEGIIEKGFDDRSHSKALDILVSTPVLVLDDLGKERLTARLEADLFAVIDDRTSNLRTTIITTNYTGDRLVERFQNKETGVAFVRRLRDYFNAISA